MNNTDSPRQDLPLFTRKLKRLFREVKNAEGKEYSPSEVQVRTGGALTASYIWRLLSGAVSNPSYNVIRALADFFQVEPNYFFEEDESGSLLARPRKERLLAEMMREAGRLDENGVQRVIEMVAYINELRDNLRQEEGGRAGPAD
jgi:transcriptional regulator with XRE-family HTH domain